MAQHGSVCRKLFFFNFIRLSAREFRGPFYFTITWVRESAAADLPEPGSLVMRNDEWKEGTSYSGDVLTP
jgi:hypothetical protein